MSYLKREEASRRTGLSSQTIQRYGRMGKIKTIELPSRHKLYDISTLIPETERKDNIEEKNICYCRVSTHGQKDDLERQIAYMHKQYPEYEVLSDIGSGINFKRKNFQKIIDYAIRGNLKTLVVAYRDRLCRIGYELVEHILLTYSQTNIIVDSHEHETLNDEIANDILQIITVYSAKINGMRSYKTV